MWNNNNLNNKTMAHRLAHINRRKQNETNNQGQQPQQAQTMERQTNPNMGYQPNFSQQTQTNANQPKTTSKKIPRPIHYPVDKVFEHDKNSFRKGLPAFPSSDSLYKSQNTYDAGPQFCRPTSAMMQLGTKKFNFPFGVWVQPFGSPKVHNIRVSTPLRCQRCKAYVNPYFKHDSTNKSSICNICGIRFQISEKADKACLYTPQVNTEGVIDFTVEDSFYFRKRRDVIKVIFAIQMTLPMIETGLFATAVQSIKSTMESSTFQPNIRFGVVYYNDEGVSFLKYKRIRNEAVDEQTGKVNVTYSTDLQSQPIQYQAHVKDGVYCCPLSDKDFLYDANDQTSKEIFLRLLDTINQRSQKYIQKGKYCNTANYFTTVKCLQQSFENQTGRIMLFSLVDPRNGPGAIRNRTQEQSKHPLKPIHSNYNQLAKELISSRIGVDHYVFSKEHITPHELQTTQFISSLTGGNLNLYAPYRAQNHSEHLYYSIFKNITKEYVYDVDFTCRVSNGLQVGQFLVNDGARQSRDVSLSMMDPSHSVAVTFIHEDKIQDYGGAYLQFAMMYTNGNGQRRIRIINYRYHLTDKLEQIHQAADYMAFANILARKYVSKLRTSQPIKVREQFLNKLVTILAEYRQQSPYGLKYNQLSIHPHLAPALSYLHSVFNSKLFLNWIKTTPDYRVCEIHKIHNFGFLQFALRYYPHVFSISTDIYEGELYPGDLIETESEDQQIAIIPQNIPLSRAFLKDDGVYLYNTGDYLVILVMPNSSPELLNDLFQNQNLTEIEENGLPQSQVSSHNIRINYIVNELRRRNQQYNGIYQPLLVRTVNQKALFGDLINSMLKEDYPQLNYTAFLESLHRAIQSKGK